MKKLRVAVLMGGRSAERAVSLSSGRASVAALKKLGHRVLVFDPGHRDFPRALLRAKSSIDMVFMGAMHGPVGEDGTLQGFLEVVGLPYTGSGVRASACALHKPSAKRLFEAWQLPTPTWGLLRQGSPVPPWAGPVVVKPASQGSAIGTTIVNTRAQFSRAIRTAFRVDEEVLVERFIKGREITVGILGDMALPVIEVLVKPQYPFYTYIARYKPGATRHEVPARLSLNATQRIQEVSLAAHRALGCRGATRVDLVVTPREEPYLLEVNTNPGLTPTSLLPDAARAIGMSFESLIQWMLDDALGYNPPRS